MLNGDELEFTDHKMPKLQPSLQVALQINLLNPDRYEFYTFDDNGELIKRLMTMQEIQSIVANGDGVAPSIIHMSSVIDCDPEQNVQDKNNTVVILHVLDTPDVSSSWSMILRAIFDNTGGDIFPQHKPPPHYLQPVADLLESSANIPPSTKNPKTNKRKPRQKRKPTTPRITTTSTQMTPQIIQEELGPEESVYTGIQQYHNMADKIPNLEGLQFQVKPIYQKRPSTAATVESTTRKTFVNNQEVVHHSNANKRPATTVVQEENLAKKPVGVQHVHKHTTPQRIKKPGSTSAGSKSPQFGANKQKIKKHPSCTTPLPSSTTAETATEASTTTTTTSTTTTTTTTPQPITTTST